MILDGRSLVEDFLSITFCIVKIFFWLETNKVESFILINSPVNQDVLGFRLIGTGFVRH